MLLPKQQISQGAAESAPPLPGVGTAHSSPELRSGHGKLAEGPLLWFHASPAWQRPCLACWCVQTQWQNTDGVKVWFTASWPFCSPRSAGLVKKGNVLFVQVCLSWEGWGCFEDKGGESGRAAPWAWLAKTDLKEVGWGMLCLLPHVASGLASMSCCHGALFPSPNPPQRGLWWPRENAHQTSLPVAIWALCIVNRAKWTKQKGRRPRCQLWGARNFAWDARDLYIQAIKNQDSTWPPAGRYQPWVRYWSGPARTRPVTCVLCPVSQEGHCAACPSQGINWGAQKPRTQLRATLPNWNIWPVFHQQINIRESKPQASWSTVKKRKRKKEKKDRS